MFSFFFLEAVGLVAVAASFVNAGTLKKRDQFTLEKLSFGQSLVAFHIEAQSLAKTFERGFARGQIKVDVVLYAMSLPVSHEFRCGDETGFVVLGIDPAVRLSVVAEE